MTDHVTRVKICCISSPKEAWLAINCGASALGLVSAMPSGPGVISEDQITEIASIVPPGISTFLLTSKQKPDEIIRQQRKCGVNTIQLCDRIAVNDYEQLRAAMPGIALVQVIHVSNEDAIEEAKTVSAFVNGILLDSGNLSLPTKELGGTGRTHNWLISRQICENVKVPVYLAGGLNADNVQQAIQEVRPFGVDICSGVRTDGQLDETKLGRFMDQVHSSLKRSK